MESYFLGARNQLALLGTNFHDAVKFKSAPSLYSCTNYYEHQSAHLVLRQPEGASVSAAPPSLPYLASSGH